METNIPKRFHIRFWSLVYGFLNGAAVIVFAVQFLMLRDSRFENINPEIQLCKNKTESSSNFANPSLKNVFKPQAGCPCVCLKINTSITSDAFGVTSGQLSYILSEEVTAGNSEGLLERKGTIDLFNARNNTMDALWIFTFSIVGAVIMMNVLLFIYIWIQKCRKKNEDDIDEGFQTTDHVLENEQQTRQNNEGINSLHLEGGRPNPMPGTNVFKSDVEGMQRSHLQMLINWGKSVGQLRYADGLTATVFRVGKKSVLTAMHVFRNITNETTANGINCNFNNLSRVTIFFPGDNDVEVNFNIEPILIAGDDTLDYAVLHLTESRSQTYPKPFHFQMEPTLSKDRFVHIIGYGSKNNTHQTFEFKIKIIPQNSERIKQAKAYIDAKRPALLADLQHYPRASQKLNTAYDKLSEDGMIPIDFHQEKGASGAPCVNIDNSYPVVGGIVLGGEPNFYFDLDDSDLIPSKHRIEYAVSMVAIRNHMRQHHPDIEVDVFGSCTESQMETDD